MAETPSSSVVQSPSGAAMSRTAGFVSAEALKAAAREAEVEASRGLAEAQVLPRRRQREAFSHGDTSCVLGSG